MPINVRLVTLTLIAQMRLGLASRADPFLVRFRTQPVASVTTFVRHRGDNESRVEPLLGDFVENTSGA